MCHAQTLSDLLLPWCCCVSAAGIGGLGIFLLLLCSMGLTAGGMYGVYQVYVVKRMQADMRNILEEYVPLNSAPSSSSRAIPPCWTSLLLRWRPGCLGDRVGSAQPTAVWRALQTEHQLQQQWQL